MRPPREVVRALSERTSARSQPPSGRSAISSRWSTVVATAVSSPATTSAVAVAPAFAGLAASTKSDVMRSYRKNAAIHGSSMRAS